MKHIMTCNVCGNYSLKDVCCKEKCIKVGPPKFKPKDPYAKYRRTVKLKEYKEQGFL
tara:strand:- start:492 stop:662 length:171 start_codon:yes stop_codon:yes gene_type:complete